MSAGNSTNPLDGPPWDSLPNFDLPITTYPALGDATAAPPNNVARSLIGADPRRWALLIGWNTRSGTTMLVGTDPLTHLATGGIALNAQMTILSLTYPVYGPLVQAQWYGIATGPGDFCVVVAVAAKDWPAVGKDPLAAIRHARPKPRVVKPTTAPGVNGGQGVSEYWLNLLARLRGR